jgi:transposase-like protein
LNLTNSNPFINMQRTRAQERVNYSAIARELGVSPSHVRRVALGFSTSARVLKRLVKEWRQNERKSERAA